MQACASIFNCIPPLLEKHMGRKSKQFLPS
uniref:Uncharacterized protein n=1 Tax=Anguilla anguilla TaxID=7936 RepID=A0A0E9W3F1_ANGAN